MKNFNPEFKAKLETAKAKKAEEDARRKLELSKNLESVVHSETDARKLISLGAVLVDKLVERDFPTNILLIRQIGGENIQPRGPNSSELPSYTSYTYSSPEAAWCIKYPKGYEPSAVVLNLTGSFYMCGIDDRKIAWQSDQDCNTYNYDAIEKSVLSFVIANNIE